MNKIELKYKEIIDFFNANRDETVIKKYSRYFKEGYDAYGIDHKILGAQKAKWLDEWQNEMDTEEYLLLGDKLIASGKFEEVDMAIQLIASRQNDFDINVFNRVGLWLENGIQNWGNTDVFCMVVLFKFLTDGVVQPDDFSSWIISPSKWKRRAVPVTFVEVIKKGFAPEPILSVIDDLMEDAEEDVQKGLGTLLREIWKKYPETAENFLLKWKDKCGRKIIQYATEKMDKEQKLKFKKNKK